MKYNFIYILISWSVSGNQVVQAGTHVGTNVFYLFDYSLLIEAIRIILVPFCLQYITILSCAYLMDHFVPTKYIQALDFHTYIIGETHTLMSNRIDVDYIIDTYHLAKQLEKRPSP